MISMILFLDIRSLPAHLEDRPAHPEDFMQKTTDLLS